MTRWKKGQRASERLDKRDLATLARLFLMTVRCSCGRLKVIGYYCPHCNDIDGERWRQL